MSDRRETRSRDPEPRRGRDDEDRGHSRGRDDDRGGRGGSRFNYQARDKADADKRMSQGGKDFDKFIDDSIKLFKVNDGDNAIRILPPTWSPTKHYGLDIYVHYGVGADRQTYLCPSKMQNKACPICEERERALSDGDDKHAKELDAKKRVLVYVIDRDNEKEGLMAWAMPWTVDRDIVSVSVDKRSGEVLPIDHPDEGYDIFFKKSGAKDRTEYTGVQVARRESKLGKDSWLDAAVDKPLPEALVFFDYDHIAKVFGGGGAVKDDRGDDRGRSRDRDDPPVRGRERDDPPARRREEPEYTWASIHKLEGDELDDLIDEEVLDLDAGDFKSDEELADAICLKLDIEEPRREPETQREPEGRRREAEPEGRGRRSAEPDPEPEGRRRRSEPEPEPEGRSRLREMRDRRG